MNVKYYRNTEVARHITIKQLRIPSDIKDLGMMVTLEWTKTVDKKCKWVQSVSSSLKGVDALEVYYKCTVIFSSS